MSGNLTKLTANFGLRSVAAIESAMEVTDDNQTDVLNRSVLLYGHVVKEIAEGKRFVVEDPVTGERERIVLL